MEAAQEITGQVDRIEIDIRRCGSGELVLFCDSKVDRVTAKSGSLRDFDWSELEHVTILNTTATVPTFSQFLDRVSTEIGLHVDLKEAGIASDAMELACSSQHDIWFFSAKKRILSEIRNAGWSGGTGFIFHDDFEENLEFAKNYNCSFIEVPAELCLRTNLIELADDANIAVIAGTKVRAGERESQLANQGIDGLMVDDLSHLPQH